MSLMLEEFNKDGRMCGHPELYPTQWNQSRPEPAKVHMCECGQNSRCPVCGYGIGCHPCECDRKYMAEHPTAPFTSQYGASPLATSGALLVLATGDAMRKVNDHIRETYK